MSARFANLSFFTVKKPAVEEEVLEGKRVSGEFYFFRGNFRLFQFVIKIKLFCLIFYSG